MKKLHNYVLAIFSIIAINACQKPGVESDYEADNKQNFNYNSSTNKQITVIEGRLVFTNGEAFSTAVKELQKIKDYSIWESQFKGYKSSRALYEEWSSKDDKTAESTIDELKSIVKKTKTSKGIYDYQRIVQDDLLATLISSKGLIQIGDTVCLFIEDAVRRTPVKSIDQLFAQASPLVKTSVNEKLPINIKVRDTKSGRLAARLDQDSYDELFYTVNADLYRYHPNWWAIRYNFTQSYTSTGIKIDHQRDGTFAWRTSNAFNWNCNYTWQIYNYIGGTMGTPVLEAYNINAPSANDVSTYQPFRVQFSPSPPPFLVLATGTWISTGRDGTNHSLYFSINTTTN